MSFFHQRSFLFMIFSSFLEGFQLCWTSLKSVVDRLERFEFVKRVRFPPLGMESGINLMDRFDEDATLSVMLFLDDPADLIRASAVSRTWNNLVISNGLCKKLCLKMVPEISYIARVVERNRGTTRLLDVTSSNPTSWETLKREHQLYASLLRAFSPSATYFKECVACVVGASSTDRYPDHSVMHTLFPNGERPWGGSYWSSMGKSDPNASEFIVFRLVSAVCAVTEIQIRPHDVFWEPGNPVYAAKFVRFRLGHPKSKADFEVNIWSSLTQQSASDAYSDNYVWTYTSPMFPMKQDCSLQAFKLPQPALCLGGFLLIELLGGSQSEEDGLFYMRIGYIRILGRPLRPAFDLKMEASGELVLKYNPEALDSVLQGVFVETSREADGGILSWLKPFVALVMSDRDEVEDELEGSRVHEAIQNLLD